MTSSMYTMHSTKNDDTVSQPVTLVKLCSDQDLPSHEPLNTGNFSKFHSSVMSRGCAAATASSTVRTTTLVYPSFAASSKCSSMHESASSCVHGAGLTAEDVSMMCTDHLLASVKG